MLFFQNILTNPIISHFFFVTSHFGCDILVENIFKVIGGDNVLVLIVYC